MPSFSNTAFDVQAFDIQAFDIGEPTSVWTDKSPVSTVWSDKVLTRS